MTAITRNTSERVYGTYVKYECDAGQRMVDGGTYRILKCDASKEWSDEVTSCGCEYDVTISFSFCLPEIDLTWYNFYENKSFTKVKPSRCFMIILLRCVYTFRRRHRH